MGFERFQIWRVFSRCAPDFREREDALMPEVLDRERQNTARVQTTTDEDADATCVSGSRVDRARDRVTQIGRERVSIIGVERRAARRKSARDAYDAVMHLQRRARRQPSEADENRLSWPRVRQTDGARGETTHLELWPADP